MLQKCNCFVYIPRVFAPVTWNCHKHSHLMVANSVDIYLLCPDLGPVSWSWQGKVLISSVLQYIRGLEKTWANYHTNKQLAWGHTSVDLLSGTVLERVVLHLILADYWYRAKRLVWQIFFLWVRMEYGCSLSSLEPWKRTWVHLIILKQFLVLVSCDVDRH